MGKKLFGGSRKGRFSGAQGSNSREPELNGEDEELELEDGLETDVPENAPLPPKTDDASGSEELDDDEPAPAPRRRESGAGRKRQGKKEKKQKRKRSRLRIVCVLLSILLFLELAYCLVIFTDLIPPVARLRSIYIETAMSTMRHQWLAKALIPGDIVQAVVDSINQSMADQVGVNSGWEDVTEPPPEETKSPSSGFSKDAAAEMLSLLAQDIGLSDEIDDFFELFHELDEASVQAYVDEHPEAVANGWDKFYVNEAGLDDEGTTMMTNQGDQVLAINAEHGLLVIRVTGSTYRGVLVIGKDASRLMCAPSSQWGRIGERAGVIAEANNGLVAMTGSGFGDGAGVAEGADQAGGAMYSGVAKGTHYPYGHKRVELHLDNRLYITDAHKAYSSDCTDATEWTPALIVDGKLVVLQDNGGYTALNPRACIGQTKDESIMFLGIEGRYLDSMGCDAVECGKILERYGAYQAMNVDGGTSAILWYEGEYIMRCSNEALPEGRRLPNAWVYCADTVPDPE